MIGVVSRTEAGDGAHGRTWYSNDPEDGVAIHDRREEAEQASVLDMEHHADCARNDYWHEDMDRLSWGEMVPWARARCAERKCPFTCPHGDRCTLLDGHDGNHNHADCDCNEPDVAVADPPEVWSLVPVEWVECPEHARSGTMVRHDRRSRCPLCSLCSARDEIAAQGARYARGATPMPSAR